MPAYPIKPNNIGLTAFHSVELGGGQLTYLEQLTEQNVYHTTVELPHLVGMGGTAYTISYISPRTEDPVTVLVVPVRYEVDGFAEDYYYFEGMTLDDNLAKGESWWIEEVYDRRRELV